MSSQSPHNACIQFTRRGTFFAARIQHDVATRKPPGMTSGENHRTRPGVAKQEWGDNQPASQNHISPCPCQVFHRPPPGTADSPSSVSSRRECKLRANTVERASPSEWRELNRNTSSP
jgi:hypothetical protein